MTIDASPLSPPAAVCTASLKEKCFSPLSAGQSGISLFLLRIEAAAAAAAAAARNLYVVVVGRGGRPSLFASLPPSEASLEAYALVGRTRVGGISSFPLGRPQRVSPPSSFALLWQWLLSPPHSCRTREGDKVGSGPFQKKYFLSTNPCCVVRGGGRNRKVPQVSCEQLLPD